MCMRSWGDCGARCGSGYLTSRSFWFLWMMFENTFNNEPGCLAAVSAVAAKEDCQFANSTKRPVCECRAQQFLLPKSDDGVWGSTLLALFCLFCGSQYVFFILLIDRVSVVTWSTWIAEKAKYLPAISLAFGFFWHFAHWLNFELIYRTGWRSVLAWKRSLILGTVIFFLQGFIRDKFLFGSVMAYYPLVAFEFLMFCFPDESSSTKAKRKVRNTNFIASVLTCMEVNILVYNVI